MTAPMEFELTYYDIIIPHISHYVTGSSPEQDEDSRES